MLFVFKHLDIITFYPGEGGNLLFRLPAAMEDYLDLAEGVQLFSCVTEAEILQE
jgi:hypothetical protein